MTVPDAALLYESDGYTIARKDLKGRHMVGDTFLRAVVSAAGAEPVRAYVGSRASAQAFADQVASIRKGARAVTIQFGDFPSLSRVGTLYLPGPGLPEQAFQRARYGGAAFSLVGVTHTISSHAAMDSIVGLVRAPTMPWDALVCTSSAVVDAVRTLISAEADHLAWRFGGGARMPALPQLPVIPLGVHCGDFTPDPAARTRARAALGVSEDETLALFVGRLSFHSKAHPHAMYRALQRVAERTGRPIALLQCGYFSNPSIETAFRSGAADYCPDVKALFSDGRDPQARADAFQAADLFISLSDNHQETFGLTPLEGMAAGLPVVVTDWDGYRDTVREGVDGFRIPTRAPAPDVSSGLDFKHAAGLMSYDRYIGNACMAVSVDHDRLAARIAALVEDPQLMRRMGEAGRARAIEAFDWAVIHGRYRELYAELAAVRTAEAGRAAGSRPSPSRPEPFALFAGYPSAHVGPATVVRARDTLEAWRHASQHGLYSFAAGLVREDETERVIAALANGALAVETLLARCELAPSHGIILVCQLLKVGILSVDPAAEASSQDVPAARSTPIGS